MMRKKDKLLTAVAISLVLHVLFLIGSTQIKITSKFLEKVRERKNFKIHQIRAEMPERKTAVFNKQADFNNRIKFQQPADSDLNKKIAQQEKMEKYESVIQDDQKIEKIDSSRAEEIEKTPTQKVRDLSVLKKQPLMDSNAPMIEVSKLTEQNAVIEPKHVIEVNEPEEFHEKMPGFTPKWNPLDKDISTKENVEGANDNYQPLISKKSHFTDLKEYLISEILTYQDPKTNEKYFQINMKVGKDGFELKTIKKEIVFLIDCSKSTTENRFRQFKEGLEYSLKNLNPGDSFNILAFKKFIVEFMPESVPPTEENIGKALFFVDRLTLGTKTDTYNALLKSISRSIQTNPSYIILLSDGLPTQGVTDPRRIINEVSQLNNGQRSIFGFSGGLHVNRYLLDFITYKNRGWSEYSYRSHQIGKYMSNLYNKIKDPLLVNVRYNASGLNEDQIFPKLLPDFFRNVEFTLYGKYDKEDKFLLQMVGDVEGKVTEFVVEAALSEAAKGSADIAKNWAYNKIYDLIGQLKDDQDNTALTQQIEELSKRYKINTPYLNQ
ncbi:MAG: VWA domain-containing protein [Candidatus Omnitrophica bacterium]|nr:VWA domain-containing protein [Candidatus Omnitrophota bacterium]